ncbi:MAG: NAD/NADP octopine/nopaline dehydrogenase family protein, partial [Pseudomonadota bacterium]
AVKEAGGLHATGELSGFAEIAYAGHDIAEALDGADIIYAVGPAYSTRAFAEACKPHLRPEHIVVVCPSSCGGAFEFKRAAGLDFADTQPLIAETSTLPYAVRITGPAQINVFLKLRGGVYLAALPASASARVLAATQDVYPQFELAQNVMQTSLQNGNPVIHPSVSLLNTAVIERTAGELLFYEQGVTPAVGRVLKAVDAERIAIGRAMGLEVLPDPEIGLVQGYMANATYDVGYSKAPGFKGIRAQSSLDNRYFHEDVGFGLVFLQDLGGQLGVKTPVIDAMITLVSAVMDRNYLVNPPRTMASLGLAGLDAEGISALLG